MTPRDPFRMLDPPPGGLAALRVRLDRREGRGVARAAAWALIPAAATALLLLAPWSPPDPWRDVDNPALVRLGLQPARTGAPVLSRSSSTAVTSDGVIWWLGAPADDEP